MDDDRLLLTAVAEVVVPCRHVAVGGRLQREPGVERHQATVEVARGGVQILAVVETVCVIAFILVGRKGVVVEALPIIVSIRVDVVVA